MSPQTAPPAASPAAHTASGKRIESIVFVERADDLRPAVVEFPEADRRAVLVGSRSADATGSDAAVPREDFALMTVPAAADDAGAMPAEILAWVGMSGPLQTIALHGAAVAWASDRAAVMVEPTRLDAVRAAIVDFWFRERELRAIEDAVAAAWPAVEDDAGLAFEFRDRDADRRHALGERFRRAVALGIRLARLAPHLEQPPTQPPTLASQVGERLRERSRMAERAGHLADRLEVQERVYELCGQRASDWALARRSTRLEWAIVVLLAVETVLILVDLLATRRV